MVFTLMTGSFSGLTALCADLNDLFRGPFLNTMTVESIAAPR